MAERRKGKKRKEVTEEKPTKEEYAVAKFLRFNVPCKDGKLVGMEVKCFIASKAVDALLESKWAKGKDPLFTTRNSCIDYCERLLMKNMYHRAAKIERKEKRKKKEEIEEDPKKERKSKKKKEKENGEKDKGSEAEKEKEKESEKEKEPAKKEEEKKKKEKKERRWKLEMHDEQIFKDGEEVYVWIYDPVPLKTFLIGLLLVLGAIGICLFPLWPPEVRLGVYYLSLVLAGFVGVIMALCVVRLILFCLVWCITFGKHHFWFLPNLTEDVGFFESFVPLYHHESFSGDKENKDEDKEEKTEETDKKNDTETKEDTPEKKSDEAEEEKNSEGGEEESGSGGENDNAFEIVNPDEVKEEETEETKKDR